VIHAVQLAFYFSGNKRYVIGDDWLLAACKKLTYYYDLCKQIGQIYLLAVRWETLEAVEYSNGKLPY